MGIAFSFYNGKIGAAETSSESTTNAATRIRLGGATTDWKPRAVHGDSEARCLAFCLLRAAYETNLYWARVCAALCQTRKVCSALLIKNSCKLYSLLHSANAD